MCTTKYFGPIWTLTPEICKRVVPELELLTVLLDRTSKSIRANEQPNCHGPFCWLYELALPAAEV